MDTDRLLTYFQNRHAEMVDAIRVLVEQETPSDDKERLDAFARVLQERFAATGAGAVTIANPERGEHVRAHFASDGAIAEPNAAPALVLCHYDTVWPLGSLASHPFRVDGDGRAYGPGIFDMQSNLVLAEYALRAIRDLGLRLPRPVVVLMTSDEEVGSPTSRALIEAEARKSAYALVMESPLPGGVLKTARKGTGSAQLRVTGQAAHAGVEPERGISAVQELAHQILALHSLTDLEAGTTVNVGVIRGGTRSNVVAAQAEADVDLRAWTQEEAQRILDTLYGLKPVTPGARLEVIGEWNRPPLERKMTADLFRRARAVALRLGLDLQEGSTGGGSDGSFTAGVGTPTLDGLGVPGHGAHADHEHIEVDGIPGRAALLAALLVEI